MKEELFQKNRFIDLSRMSYERGVYTFTDFLTLAEQSDLYDCTKDLYGRFETSGGYAGAERVIARFGSSDDLGYDQAFPISVIKIAPLQAKFAENLTHRDFLGSLMNLGIERHKFGDIIINRSGNNTNISCAYVFASDDISDYICKEITRIRHTSVSATLIDDITLLPGPELRECNFLVKSERIDAVIAKVYNLSRSQSAELFGAQKVFINGRLMENESHTLKADSLVSVRGYGRFNYMGVSGTTKKGSLNIVIQQYV